MTIWEREWFPFILQIYHASNDFGTDDIRTAGGYYHMANIFFRQNNMVVADSLYSRVSFACIPVGYIYAEMCY